MKRTLLLFCALLTLGGSGAWADGTITISSAEGGWSSNGTYYEYYNSGWSTHWYSNSSALTLTCSPAYYMTQVGVMADAIYTLRLPLGKITGYSISFKLYSGKSTVTLTAADNTTSATNTSKTDAVTLNVTGLSTSETKEVFVWPKAI